MFHIVFLKALFYLARSLSGILSLNVADADDFVVHAVGIVVYNDNFWVVWLCIALTTVMYALLLCLYSRFTPDITTTMVIIIVSIIMIMN